MQVPQTPGRQAVQENGCLWSCQQRPPRHAPSAYEPTCGSKYSPTCRWAAAGPAWPRRTFSQGSLLIILSPRHEAPCASERLREGTAGFRKMPADQLRGGPRGTWRPRALTAERPETCAHKLRGRGFKSAPPLKALVSVSLAKASTVVRPWSTGASTGSCRVPRSCASQARGAGGLVRGCGASIGGEAGAPTSSTTTASTGLGIQPERGWSLIVTYAASGRGGATASHGPRPHGGSVGKQFVQTFVALAHAFLHTTGNESVASLEGVDQRRRR